MKSINDHLTSKSPEYDVFTFNFTAQEVEEINKALQKQSWIEEVRGLLEEEWSDNPYQE